MVTKRSQQPRFPDNILHTLILIGNIANKDDDLIAQILHLPTLLDILLAVTEQKRQGPGHYAAALQHFLGESHVYMEYYVQALQDVEQSVQLKRWNVLLSQCIDLFTFSLALEKQANHCKSQQLDSCLEVYTYGST